MTTSTSSLAGFGARLQEVLTASGMSQAEFAARIPCAASFMSAMLRNEKLPGAEVLCSLRTQFQVSIDWLLTGDGAVFAGNELDVERYRLVLALTELARRAEAGADADALKVAEAITTGKEKIEALSDKAAEVLETCLVDKSDAMTAALSYSEHAHVLDSQAWAAGIVRNARIYFKMSLPLRVRKSITPAELTRGVQPGAIHVSGGTDVKAVIGPYTEHRTVERSRPPAKRAVK